ncbi:MAG: DNA polymerase III subunit beta, partial [Bacteroidota bacterium]|nr:DNA polymerase III subunit beta [Bacteroidota bacterium]
KGLGVISRAVAGRSTLQILSNVLISTDDDGLKLSASNLEIGINSWIGAKVEVSGAIAIPARLLSEFVNSLPPERVDLELDEVTQVLNVRCAHFEANLKGIDAQEFPSVPGLDAGGDVIHIDAEILKQAINQVVLAAAVEESQPVLTGILAQFENEQLILSGTDGFRLSTKIIPLALSLETPFEVIIPARALSELARVLGSQDLPVQIAITPSQNQILFHLENIDLVSQLIEGRFPDVSQIIPKSHTTRTLLDAKNFLKAARVSYLFARDASNIVKLEIIPGDGELVGGRVVFSATSQELGDNITDLEAGVDGERVEIAFNAKFLIDVLSVMNGAQIILETSAPASPGMLKMQGDDTFQHVIMPMHLSR